MSATKQNHQSDFATLSRLSGNFEKQIEFSLVTMGSSVTRLVRMTHEDASSPKIMESRTRQFAKETCDEVRRFLDMTAEEMAKLHPFDTCTLPEPKTLLLIKEKGAVLPNGTTTPDKTMYNLFFGEARITIDSARLSKLVNASEKTNTEEVLATLTRLNLVYQYHTGADYPGSWFVELTPLGKKLTELVQKQRDVPARQSNIELRS